MVKCFDCGKDVFEDGVVYCEICGAALCLECATTGYCANCGELWETEMDLEDMETEEETQSASQIEPFHVAYECSS